ncbi:MAG TPA: plastocyanin/azurin family copper-binding protein [Gemmatimonadales bacterium]|nr:plastocyanin/azurin family copper-binding protein [Gemmatimonadales bacterium]
MTTDGRRFVRVPLAALAAIGILAFAGAAGPTPPTAPQRHVIEIKGMAFHPEVLQVNRGDTVVWVNRDIVPHTATSTRKSAWDTGPLVQGKSGQHIARHKGEDPYFCRLHPVMLGKLIVR